ncbi:MAG: hypothetical protein QW128_05605 [Thermoprotei archaeon]
MRLTPDELRYLVWLLKRALLDESFDGDAVYAKELLNKLLTMYWRCDYCGAEIVSERTSRMIRLVSEHMNAIHGMSKKDSEILAKNYFKIT